MKIIQFYVASPRTLHVKMNRIATRNGLVIQKSLIRLTLGICLGNVCPRALKAAVCLSVAVNIESNFVPLRGNYSVTN